YADLTLADPRGAVEFVDEPGTTPGQLPTAARTVERVRAGCCSGFFVVRLQRALEHGSRWPVAHEVGRRGASRALGVLTVRVRDVPMIADALRNRDESLAVASLTRDPNALNARHTDVR